MPSTTSAPNRCARRAGPVTRWKLFDCPWDDGKDHLVGQEEVQGAIYRLVSNFAREGRTNRLILMHGPNGSAKSTLVACLQRALEHYSTLDEGALYRFNWIFPSQRVAKTGIGFSGGVPLEPGSTTDSYAYLEDDLIEAKIVDELRDHPILLLPRGKRRALIDERLADDAQPGVPPRLPAEQRRPVAPEPANLRGAALLVPRRHRQGPAPHPGRTLLRLPPLPTGGGHRRAAAGGRRPLAAADHGPVALLAAAGAAVADPVRGAGRAGRRQPGHPRLRRPAQAPARVVQVSAGHGRAGPHLHRRGGAGGRHGFRRLLQRGLPGRLQGAARVPVLQGPHGAGAGALPSRLPAGAEDLRGPHQVLHRHRRGQTRRAPRVHG